MRLLLALLTFAALAGYYWICKYVVTNAASEYGIVVTLIGVSIFCLGCYQIAVIIERRDRNKFC